MSWADLQPNPVPVLDADQTTIDLDKLYLRVFSTKDGSQVLKHLRAVTIEQPTWYPGEEASHGYAREGQNSLVREIERKIERARNN